LAWGKNPHPLTSGYFLNPDAFHALSSKCVCGRVFAPDPARRTDSGPQDTLAGGEEASSFIPLSAFAFGPRGLQLSLEGMTAASWRD